MQIQILSVDVTTKTSAKGKNYQNAEVAYKNFDSGKVESKNITQYSDVFRIVAEANPNQTFDVHTQKDDAGYWQWKSMKRIVLEGDAQKAPDLLKSAATPAGSYSKPTYETPEERAQKQVYIVKQSSISNAISVLSLGAKTPPPTTEQVLQLAQTFTDWVFQSPKLSLEATPNDFPDVE